LKKSKEKKLLFIWLKEIARQSKRQFDIKADDPHLGAKCLTLILRSSPTLRSFLPVLQEHVVDYKQKAIVWVCFPGQQAFVDGVLRMTRIDCEVLHVGLNGRQRRELTRRFNDRSSDGS
jgi:hypothetical protein